jgi:hypothetical protein
MFQITSCSCDDDDDRDHDICHTVVSIRITAFGLVLYSFNRHTHNTYWYTK